MKHKIKKSTCSHTIVYALLPSGNDWPKWMGENNNNSIYQCEKMAQVTNLQMYTQCKTVNKCERLPEPTKEV